MILDAAVREFAVNGFELASLRAIAKAAGCSLTLLVHHFGNKSGLVRAVVSQQQQSCEKRLVPLRARLATHDLTFEELASAWTHYEFEQHSTREGRLYLHVMLRLQTDPKVDEETRQILNCSEIVVTKGLQRACPGLDEPSRKGLWLLASGGLYAVLTNLDRIGEIATTEAMAAVRARAVDYLVSGLCGYCRGVTA